MKPIGTVIKEIRLKRGMTQQQLADKSGLEQAHISQVETRAKSNPSLKTLQAIASGLEVPLPVIQFMCLEDSDIQPSKLKAFKKIEPATMALINEFFFETKPKSK